MRNKIYIFLFLLLGLFGINLILPIHAANTQWFPDVGTNIEYDLSNSITLMDYSQGESETFNIYYYSTTLVIVPTYLDTNFPAIPSGMNLNVSNVEVTFLVNFTEKSPTELYRNVRLKVGDEILSDKNIALAMFRDGSFLYAPIYEISSNNRFVDKLNFFTSASFIFLDYFDSTLGAGASILSGLEILTVTPNQIIATKIGSPENQTYVADRSGKVQTFSTTYHIPEMLVSGYRKADFIFTSRKSTTNGSIPGYDLYLIIGIIGILTVVLIRKSKNKL